jgi:hypothetical protein
MPITNTLDISRRLTQAGVPTQQAEVFSELFEATAQDAVREMKAIVVQEAERTRAELRAEFRAAMADQRTEFRTALGDQRTEFQRDLRTQMIWYVATQVALIGAAAAILKLLFV